MMLFLRREACYEVVLWLFLTFLMTVLFVLCSSRDLRFVMFGFENQG